jgi:hypothetical protein
MTQVNILAVSVSNDTVIVEGLVNGVDTKAQTWLSHLYPPKDQDLKSAARGCQTDQDRVNHLSDVLLIAAGIVPQQELTATIQQALEVLITKQDPTPIVIDPTVAAAIDPVLVDPAKV